MYTHYIYINQLSHIPNSIVSFRKSIVSTVSSISLIYFLFLHRDVDIFSNILSS